MTEREWTQFFHLLTKAVGGGNDGVKWQARRTELRAQAEVRGSGGDLDELISWFESTTED